MPIRCPKCGAIQPESAQCIRCRAQLKGTEDVSFPQDRDKNNRSDFPELKRKRKRFSKIGLVLISFLLIFLIWEVISLDRKGMLTWTEPTNASLLYPASRLSERHFYVQESIKYFLAYYNAYINKSRPVQITELSVNESSKLKLVLNQGGQVLTFEEDISAYNPEDILFLIGQSLIEPVSFPENAPDSEIINKVDSLLASEDQFSAMESLAILDQELKKNPSGCLLLKAARSYLEIIKLNNYTSVSSLYDNFLARSFALYALGSFEREKPSDYLYIGTMLNYLSGNTKRAFEIASSEEGMNDELCKNFMDAAKRPESIRAEDPNVYWKLIFLSDWHPQITQPVLENLLGKKPQNLFIIANYSETGVGAGKEACPRLIQATIDGHLAFIRQKFPSLASELKKAGVYDNGESLFSKLIPVHFQCMGKYPVPEKDRIKKIYGNIFKNSSFPEKVNPGLFTEEDEKILFYHNLITAIQKWHFLLTDRWSVGDYAMKSAKELKKIFKKDPVIRLLYVKALFMKNRQAKAMKGYEKVITPVGDAKFLIDVHDNSALAFYGARERMLRVYNSFPENGVRANIIGRINTMGDEGKKILFAAFEKDPFNVETAYALSGDAYDFAPMQKFLQLFPEDSKGNYYAGYLKYKIFEDFEGAIGYLETALKIDPTMEPAAETLGFIYEEKGENDKAFRVYEKYLESDKDSLSAVTIREKEGLLFLKLNNISKAVKILSSAAESYKESAMYSAVIAYLASGDKENAEFWANEIFERYGGRFSYDTLCKLYYRTGEKDKFENALTNYYMQYSKYEKALLSGWKIRFENKKLFERNFGCLILEVLSGSNIQQANLFSGDIILSYNGKPINSALDFENFTYPKDAKREVEVFRKDHIIKVTIKGVPKSKLEY